MLHEDDDPLGSSMFDNTTSSLLGNTMTTSLFSSQFEEDPWGSHSTPIIQSTTTEFARSFTAPNLYSNTTSDADHHAIMNTSQFNPNTVLAGVRLPELYEKLFIQHQRSGRVSLSTLNGILSRGKISANHIEKIMQIVVPSGASYVTQSEFNTAIALLACAQSKMDVSLESLHRNRDFLPEPSIYQEHKEIKSPLKPVDENPITSEPTMKSNYQPQLSPMKHTTAYPGMKSPKESSQDKQNEETTNNNRRPSSLDTRHWFKNIEEITVTVAPEREGFIFKHVNYIVTNEKRSSIVLRRYSDFWWLLEVLLRRYPFRALPNLPPKKLGGRDTAFIEKRRKGLSRFINAIIRHPVLRHDEVVARFLTEPSELSAWRKQNPPSLEEEFKRKQHPIRELDSMTPTNLEEQLQKARKRVTAGINHYVNLCLIMERMIRRMHGQATDFSRYSIALNSLAEAELRYHAGECRNCQYVVKGYETVAKHMQTESSLLEDQVGNATDGVLENLKRFRDLLVSFRDLDERRARLSVNQTDVISKRIQANRSKIHQNKGVPGLEAEVQKLEESVRADEKELSLQQDREVFIQFCLWSELIYLHKQQAFVSSLYQNFTQSTIHFSKLRADNWQDLEEPAFNMPSDVASFE
ncbi:Sorting nexin mvp1 [Rhizopus stolonifer]|uniref:Sorting nexin MVP1 n=1 Tax=Rhizopus stolonifer TaxID=4846 RepID=A0A367K411_RHIST|nr:Sorting nexin mvp1 [Rhizopus stolonifer]